MTQEEKQLLLTDLCARLPYGVFVETTCARQLTDFSGTIRTLRAGHIELFVDGDFSEIKPYLRPMDDMTEEEEFTLNETRCYTQLTLESYDWLNAHHFDYRGLIERHLAIAVTEENNPYKE